MIEDSPVWVSEVQAETSRESALKYYPLACLIGAGGRELGLSFWAMVAWAGVFAVVCVILEGFEFWCRRRFD